jgi:glycosyltransferase involved in cell wall biosynthesis
MKIALVYDRVNKWGGAERVLLALHEIWPEAPLYTAVYNPGSAAWANVFKVIPSFLQNFPLAKTNHEFYPWVMPLAFESFNFDEFDIVLSITSEAAKGILTKPKTFHLCYCLTPTRYLWSGRENYFSSSFLKFLSSPVASYLRKWDKIACQRPDQYLAISKTVQKRVKDYYHRDSEVIYPPVDVNKFTPKDLKFKTKEGSFFLIVSRLVAYKRIDIAVKAFNRLGRPLKIVGVGRELNRLKKIARPNIQFLGQLTDQELLGYYQECQAVVFPQQEDFGLVPIEGQACGKPVIAFRAGGALESLIEGKTSLFFYPQSSDAVVGAIKVFEKIKFDPLVCRKNALNFDQKAFKNKFKKIVEKKWEVFKK